MGDLIDLRSRMESFCGDQDAAVFEVFLVEEGLELLSNFRSISNQALRDTIRRLIRDIAASETLSSK